MSLISKIEQDFKKAMLEKDQERVDLLRLIKAALKNELINLKKKELTDKEVLKVLKKEAKKRQEAIELYKKGNREELAAKEEKELVLIKDYLPEEMSQEEVKKIVQTVIAEMGEVAPSQFGQVMGKVMGKVGGQADGKVVSAIVKEVLNK